MNTQLTYMSFQCQALARKLAFIRLKYIGFMSLHRHTEFCRIDFLDVSPLSYIQNSICKLVTTLKFQLSKIHHKKSKNKTNLQIGLPVLRKFQHEQDVWLRHQEIQSIPGLVSEHLKQPKDPSQQNAPIKSQMKLYIKKIYIIKMKNITYCSRFLSLDKNVKLHLKSFQAFSA